MSGVTPGAKREPTTDESKKASEKDLVSTLRPFSRSSQDSRRRTIAGWFVSTATSSASWICRKSNLTLANSISVMATWPRRMARLRASLRHGPRPPPHYAGVCLSPQPDSSSCCTWPSCPSWMAPRSGGGNFSFLFTVLDQLGCGWMKEWKG